MPSAGQRSTGFVLFVKQRGFGTRADWSRLQWIEDGAGGAGGRVGKSAVYFFCGHVFDEDTCEQRPGTGEFVCAHCAVDPAKQRIRRGMEAGEVCAFLFGSAISICRQAIVNIWAARSLVRHWSQTGCEWAFTVVQVDPAKTNEQFFTEIRSRSNAAVFDVVAHHLGNANSLL